MTSITEIVQVGVGCVVTDVEGRFLLAERLADKHGKGQWSFPGGKPNPGESPQMAAIRELAEETGINGLAQPLGIWTYEQWPEHGVHYVTLYFMIEHGDQEPQNREPDKHGPWSFIEPEQAAMLPLFDGVAQVIGLLG